MNRRNLIFIIGAAAIIATVAGIAALRPPSSTGGKFRVTASFYPMAEFARQAGGDRVEVTTLVAPGTEPHDYDPAPGDLAQLYRSKLFVYNGAGVEPWAGRLEADLKTNQVAILVATAGLTLRHAGEGEHAHEAGESEEHAGEEHAGDDPHVWLDPVLAAAQVDAIAAALAQADPAGAAHYRSRAAAYTAKLRVLDDKFRTSLTACTRDEIITAHDAFGYLAARYGFSVIPIAGVSPDEEPAPGQLAEITRLAREHGIKHIFFETLTSPKLSDTIARETGAQTLVLNPLEGLTSEEATKGADYISVQEANLTNLKIALDCK